MAIIDNPIVSGGGTVDQETALQYMLNNKTDYTGIAAGLTAMTELPTFTQPSGIKDFYGAFSNCKSLQRIEHLDVSSSKSALDNMFYYCQALTYVPDLDAMTGQRTANGMFNHCQSLTTLPKLNWQALTACKAMFAATPIITFDETVSGSVSYTYIKDFTSMFSGCTNLTTVYIRSRGYPPSVDFTSMFSGCTNLTTVEFAMHPNVPSTTTPVYPTTSISCDSMFNRCSSLTSLASTVFDIVFRAGVTKTTTNMFNGCSSLTSFPASGTRLNSVTNCARMFQDCSSLVDVAVMNLSSVNSSEYSSAGYGAAYMFNGCLGLSNTSLNNILASMATATKITSNKTLKYIGLTSAQATTCTGLSNWAALSAAGWTTGY